MRADAYGGVAVGMDVRCALGFDRERRRLLKKGLTAALLAFLAWPAWAGDFDALMLDGAVACISPGQMREAEKAALAADAKWLQSLGCGQIKGGLHATVIERGSKYSDYIAKLRVHEAERTLWVSEWGYLRVAQSITTADRAPNGKTLENVRAILRKQFTTCAGNYASPPRGLEDFAVNVYVSRGLSGGDVRAGVETVVHSAALDSNDSFRVFASGAVRAMGRFKCESFKDATLAKILKTTGQGFYVTVPLGGAPL